MITKTLWLTLLCAGFGAVTLVNSAPVEKIGLLEGQDVIVVAADGHVIAQLTADRRAKGSLSWLPDGEHLSYVVPDDRVPHASRLVVVDLAGSIVKEVPVPPPDEGFRSDDTFVWLSPGKVRIDRSANPRNCGVFDLDIETLAVSNRQEGACGSFVSSPDGKHTVHLGLLAITSDEDREDSVEIDNKATAYRGGGDRIQVVVGPIWSEDSQEVAFIEKKVSSGEVVLTVVSLTGHFDRTPIPAEMLEDPLVTWVGSQVAIGARSHPVLVDHALKRMGEPTPEALSRIERVRQTEREAEERRAGYRKILQQLGAREGIAWPE